jgi:hypothetical protein
MAIYEEYNEYEIFIMMGGYYSNKDYEIIRPFRKEAVENNDSAESAIDTGVNEKWCKNGNVTIIHCNHNSIDFTGLITLSELYFDNIDEHYLYIHDTSRVGENFFKKLKSIDLTNVSTMKINQAYSMNIGIYSQKIINECKPFLLQKKNTNESECMKFKTVDNNEDYIFNYDKNNMVLDNFHYDDSSYTGPMDYYNTGTMRIVQYYPNLDLYKIKANWGQGVWTLNN